VPKTKRIFHRTGLTRPAFPWGTRQGSDGRPNLPCRDLSQRRSCTWQEKPPARLIGSWRDRAPLSSHKANLVLPGAGRTVREACSHGRRIHSVHAFASLQQQIMTLLSCYECLLVRDMNQAVILPFVRTGTTQGMIKPSQTTLSTT
jgi:hypothetical protein